MRLQKPKLEIRGEYCRDIIKKPWIGVFWVNCIPPQIHVWKFWLQCDYLWRQGDERSCGVSSGMQYSLWKHEDLRLGSEPSWWLTQCWGRGAGESAVRQVEPWSSLASQATPSQKNPRLTALRNDIWDWPLVSAHICKHVHAVQTCTHMNRWGKRSLKFKRIPRVRLEPSSYSGIP